MAACGHGCCDHDHSHDEEERGLQYSLYQKIDFIHLEVLNEAEEGSGKSVFRPWSERLATNKVRVYIYIFITQQSLFSLIYRGIYIANIPNPVL